MQLPVVYMQIHPIVRGVLVALLIMVGSAPRFASAQSICGTCEVQLGLGGTYHFWGRTGGVVLPLTVNWDGGRYEAGLFRISSQQTLYDARYPNGRVMAHPYWGVSVSRRWRLMERGPIRVFGGLGLAAKTESDELSVTRLDFASQLGVRYRLPGDRVVAELAVRHWSNGGIRLPNHGQDFATLTVRLNSGLFGVDRAEQITGVESVNSRGVLRGADDLLEHLP